VHTLSYFFVAVGLSEVEPIQPSVEQAFRKQASKAIQAICNSVYLGWDGLFGLQHGGKSSSEMITVKLQQIVSITFLTTNLK
jgi:hypothetical protein